MNPSLFLSLCRYDEDDDGGGETFFPCAAGDAPDASDEPDHIATALARLKRRGVHIIKHGDGARGDGEGGGGRGDGGEVGLRNRLSLVDAV